MQAGENEVLDALRVHAEQGGLPGEWANVNPDDAFRDVSLGAPREETFRSILRTLAIKGLYKPINDDLGAVKM